MKASKELILLMQSFLNTQDFVKASVLRWPDKDGFYLRLYNRFGDVLNIDIEEVPNE